MKVSVFNSQGKEVLIVNNKTLIDISNLDNGLFFIKIEIDNITKTEKVIKI
jgi:hypothetical protein